MPSAASWGRWSAPDPALHRARPGDGSGPPPTGAARTAPTTPSLRAGPDRARPTVPPPGRSFRAPGRREPEASRPHSLRGRAASGPCSGRTSPAAGARRPPQRPPGAAAVPPRAPGRSRRGALRPLPSCGRGAPAAPSPASPGPGPPARPAPSRGPPGPAGERAGGGAGPARPAPAQTPGTAVPGPYAARAAPTMPAVLRSCAGTIGVRMSSSGRNFSDLRLTPPPTTIRSGQSRSSTTR